MDITTKLELIKSTAEELITEKELKELLETKSRPVAYDGFEPSGTMHIAQGIMRSINTNKLLKAGVKFKFWVADWFAWMNNKMGGDLDKIETVGKYLIEVWKACGMDTSKVQFIWASKEMDNEYWKRTINISINSTINRIMRCSQIMGRTEKQVLSAAQIFYPCMQCSDIFELECDITHLGMDQRKVNMLAREVGPKLGYWKPIVANYHMLMGLSAPASDIKDTVERKIAMKMSKSKPDTAIFMTDTEEDIKRKMKKAYCPAKQADENPILEYCKYIIFEKFNEIEIHRPEKFGGDVVYTTYEKLERDFKQGKIHPLDLKSVTATYVNRLIEPVRKHFKKPKAKKLLEQVNSFKVTR